MKIDPEKVTAAVREVLPLFSDRKRTEQVHVKGAADFVTDTDLAVQKILGGRLLAMYPETGLLAEEKDNTDIDFSGDFWILDPVDGTTNLIHDRRMSAVSLGYCERGILTFGCIFLPYTGEMFTACLGKGAYCSGTEIHVSRAASLSESLVSIGTCPYERQHAAEDFDLFRKVFLETEDIRRSGSAAIDLAYIAAGRSDAYFERNLKPWDYAAGMLLVREAGGKVETFDGREPGFRHPEDILAGNGIIEELIREKFF